MVQDLKRVSGPVLSYVLQIDATSVFFFFGSLNLLNQLF